MESQPIEGFKSFTTSHKHQAIHEVERFQRKISQFLRRNIDWTTKFNFTEKPTSKLKARPKIEPQTNPIMQPKCLTFESCLLRYQKSFFLQHQLVTMRKWISTDYAYLNRHEISFCRNVQIKRFNLLPWWIETKEMGNTMNKTYKWEEFLEEVFWWFNKVELSLINESKKFHSTFIVR